ncbi:phosphoglycerate dehydrogenase [Noviherbaspirillum sp.]|uniref:phosphoglycerate dehydrogenase n=1 Tax=Noviherbaspirillum sp. TaxID=1926288 RepID=UPI002D700AF3|nr:phosphoglycerate dehydrogenase [Noviherbaspirillum sp.]HZW19675.1 phosphoglycerate dehydrogenase [Noviherbaspirillum sp.]
MTLPPPAFEGPLRVLLLEDIHESAERAFSHFGDVVVERDSGAPSREALLCRIGNVHVLGIRSRTQVDAEILAAATQLLAIGTYCTGTNNVALDEAAARGVPVFNGPFSNTRSVSELVIGHAIHLLRRIPERHAAARSGKWLKDARGSSELRGKTLGIIGYGKIGTQTGLLAEALGMQVVFYDIEAKLPLSNASRMPSLQALLAASDVITLHVPGTPETEGMIDAAAFEAMKQDAVLINLARGKAVCIEALCDALQSGRLRGAALDVFPVEPATRQDAFESPLRAFDNVILTPHIGGSTIEAQRNLGFEVSEKIAGYLARGTTQGCVNLPQVSLDSAARGTRIVHIHTDKPGVLMQVNDRLAASGLNIVQLTLETAKGFGVAVLDVTGPVPGAVIDSVACVDGAARVFLPLGQNATVREASREQRYA